MSVSPGKWYQLDDIVSDIPWDSERTHTWAERVVGFMVDDGRLIVEENCDQYFRASLNGRQVRELAAWLSAVADTLHQNDETPGPIPRGDQAGGASAPGEGARS